MKKKPKSSFWSEIDLINLLFSDLSAECDTLRTRQSVLALAVVLEAVVILLVILLK